MALNASDILFSSIFRLFFTFQIVTRNRFIKNGQFANLTRSPDPHSQAYFERTSDRANTTSRAIVRFGNIGVRGSFRIAFTHGLVTMIVVSKSHPHWLPQKVFPTVTADYATTTISLEMAVRQSQIHRSRDTRTTQLPSSKPLAHPPD
jgi:hypothetical protein